MTNTRLTSRVLELRYPVVLEDFHPPCSADAGSGMQAMIRRRSVS
jgi:hypothetical protein